MILSSISHKPKITIAIPTYKRPQALKRLLASIGLQQDIDGLDCAVVIHDNDPSASGQEACREHQAAFQERGWKLEYRANRRNIGAEANIAKSYSSWAHNSSDSNSFIWTIGDDDVLEDGALPKVGKAIIEDERTCLIITSRSQAADSPFDRMADKAYSTYGDLMKRALLVYPELPIHHTLISCNIIRAGIFDIGIWRKRLGTRYAQMYAIMHDLKALHSRGQPAGVRLIRSCLADEPSMSFTMDSYTSPDIYREIPFRWAEYFCWLRDLWGLDPSEYDMKTALKSDYWKQEHE